MSPRKVRLVIDALHGLGAAELPELRKRCGLSYETTMDVLTQYRKYIFFRDERAGRRGASIWSLRPVEREQ